MLQAPKPLELSSAKRVGQPGAAPGPQGSGTVQVQTSKSPSGRVLKAGSQGQSYGLGAVGTRGDGQGRGVDRWWAGREVVARGNPEPVPGRDLWDARRFHSRPEAPHPALLSSQWGSPPPPRGWGKKLRTRTEVAALGVPPAPREPRGGRGAHRGLGHVLQGQRREGSLPALLQRAHGSEDGLQDVQQPELVPVGDLWAAE